MRKGTNDYTEDWPEVAKAIKDAAGWKCVRCGHLHDPEAGYCLTVHHLDMVKSNNAWYNAIPLCQRCHLRIQAKVVMERVWFLHHSDWFKPYVAGYTAHRLGLDDERESVMAHITELLDKCAA